MIDVSQTLQDAALLGEGSDEDSMDVDEQQLLEPDSDSEHEFSDDDGEEKKDDGTYEYGETYEWVVDSLCVSVVKTTQTTTILYKIPQVQFCWHFASYSTVISYHICRFWSICFPQDPSINESMLQNY